MEEHSASIQAPLDHPCYEGHFPGNPVLPGVVLLELVAEAIGRGAPRALTAVKFQHVLLPGQSFTLRWHPDGARVVFHCERAGQPVAEGVFTFGDAP
jgi:3-hydroxymyristoyl/3-hydroxydecanoyl-(acyl carrier protein) dehydratase